MILVTSNRAKQLLFVSYIGRVRADEIARVHENMAELLAELSPGFTVLSDLSQVESTGVGCDKEIGRIMELCDKKDVGLLLRVIPDPSKDIGLNIISFFHYARHRRTVTCESMAEAMKFLPS